jgi:glutamine synthetase
VDDLNANVKKLENALEKADKMGDTVKQAELYNDQVVEFMNSVRSAADELKMSMDAQMWPLPTYPEMLFLK